MSDLKAQNFIQNQSLHPISPGQPPIKVVSFGAPPVGNDKFAEVFNKNVPDYSRLAAKLVQFKWFRIRMAWDWFPTPPLAAALGYVHVGKERVTKRVNNKLLQIPTSTRQKIL